MTRFINSHTPLLLEDESYPTERMIKNARRANRAVSTTAMVSLGLLAALITHHALEDKGWPVEAISIADTISLFTAIAGKVAIMLFFNEVPFLEGFKKICRKQLPDYFRLSEKSRIEKLQWAVNLLLSVNVSLFWSGLVEVSFKKSGDLFKKFDTKVTRAIGDQLQQWYVYLPFVLSSLYANLMAWPGAHTGAYLQKKAFFTWFRKRPWQSNPREAQLNEVNFRVDYIHRRVLKELKGAIEGNNQSPILDGLLNLDDEKYQDDSDFQQRTIVKIDQLLELEPQQLRQLYLRNSDANYVPLSKKQAFLKYGLAVGVSGAAVYGYRNVVGLSHAVWKNWGAENFSKYLGGYFTYYSNAEVVLLTVYPLLCNLFDVAWQGITPYVFSGKRLAFIISMVFFVGVFGGLANAEQSYLDGESTFDVINSNIASFLIDAFSIYIIFKSSFETTIKESPEKDSKMVLKQRFLQLQTLGQKAHELDTVTEIQDHQSMPVNSVMLKEDDDVMGDNEENIRRQCPCVIL